MTSESKRPPDARAEARLLLRQWLVRSENDVLAAIDGLGRQAIRDASQASGRLERSTSSTTSAHGVLLELQALAETFEAPAPRRRLWFSARVADKAPDPVSLNTLVASLERERDAIARTLIGIEGDGAKLQLADDALDEALQLVRACGLASESAARELALAKPAQAVFLRETVPERLLAREQDLLTQIAVTRQGILALQLVADGQSALAQAIDRARDTSVAAMRTALAARQAVAGSHDLTRQAQALENTVEAAGKASNSGRDVERALEDAAAQIRRAINAAQATARDPRSPRQET
ncbi:MULTISPECIES: toxic anion resistance protein [unclassified Novosphingobium]|uniref:toxic anion resistance protein n=1 Tax=unclassified Novosphingobium TaxID=2644732 RepID=UPI00135C872E|nr:MULTISPECIES: toxic anion resistance protein [unclassified Novosphingobium]